MTTRSLPSTAAELKVEFADRANYFAFMVQVAQSKNTPDEKAWCEYARKLMVVLGYPSETYTWSDEQTLNYAENIVAIG
jgi:hypothetical protein